MQYQATHPETGKHYHFDEQTPAQAVKKAYKLFYRTELSQDIFVSTGGGYGQAFDQAGFPVKGKDGRELPPIPLVNARDNSFQR